MARVTQHKTLPEGEPTADVIVDNARRWRRQSRRLFLADSPLIILL